MNYADSGTAALAASDPQVSNAIGLTGYDHMSINVGDFDAMLVWYADVLGLELETAWEVPALDGKRLAYFALNGSRVVEIVAADRNGRGHRRDATFAQHFGRTGFGHLCFATDSVDLTLEKLEARGAKIFVTAKTYPLDGTAFERRVGFVQDPEGNVIEFGKPLRRTAR
ncbi:MAG: VOC family protein [Pseudomonadota bacterium]